MRNRVVWIALAAVTFAAVILSSSCSKRSQEQEARKHAERLAAMTDADFRANFEKVAPGMDAKQVLDAMVWGPSIYSPFDKIKFVFPSKEDETKWLVATFHMKEGKVESKELTEYEPPPGVRYKKKPQEEAPPAWLPKAKQ